MQTLLILAIAAHFIGDFPFQTEWMGKEKGQNWEIMFYHVVVYTSTLAVAFLLYGKELSLSSMAVIFFSHLVVDALKARWKYIRHVWLDQIIHLVVLVGIVLIQFHV